MSHAVEVESSRVGCQSHDRKGQRSSQDSRWWLKEKAGQNRGSLAYPRRPKSTAKNEAALGD